MLQSLGDSKNQKEAMTNIHKTAVVSPKSNIDPSVAIGAYSIIGDDVEIGKNTKIESHVVIKGNTKIGEDNHFYSFSSHWR